MDNYNPIAVNLPATVQTTADGDAPTGAVLGGPQQVLANGIKALQDVVKPLAETVDIDRCWGVRVGGTGAVSIYTDAGVPMPIVIPSAGGTEGWEIFPPHGSSLRSATLRHYKGSGTPLVVKIWRVNLFTTVGYGGDIDDIPQATELATATAGTPADAVQSTTATISGGHIVDRTTSRYIVVVTGPGTVSDAKFFGVRAQFRIPAGTSIDQGAG